MTLDFPIPKATLTINIPNLLCFSAYGLIVLVGMLQIFELIKFQLNERAK